MLRGNVHGEPLVGAVEDAGAGAEGRTDRVSKPLAESVVSPRRSSHRDDLAVDGLMTFLGFPLEPKILEEIHSGKTIRRSYGDLFSDTTKIVLCFASGAREQVG